MSVSDYKRKSQNTSQSTIQHIVDTFDRINNTNGDRNGKAGWQMPFNSNTDICN